ncbi:MAG: response regulator [Planctomycetes bacterium]|nr:response regulator [Planctomycetota bacterium]
MKDAGKINEPYMSDVPPDVPRLTLFEEAIKEAHRHKWIESEKAGRDLGDSIIREWHKDYWRTFCRERWIEHLQGVNFWVELDNDDFGLLNRKFHDNTSLVNRIVDMLKSGGENLDVIQWAVEHDENVDEVIEVLKILDINSRRLAPAIAIDEQEFVDGMKARHNPRALVVDDDADTREMLYGLFATEGMECIAVESGEEALEEVQNRRFDLFLVDIMLPGKHGAEVAWYLHRHGVTAPILAISAVLDAWNEDDLYDCGFTQLMGKPFDLEKLRKVAQKVVAEVHEN